MPTIHKIHRSTADRSPLLPNSTASRRHRIQPGDDGVADRPRRLWTAVPVPVQRSLRAPLVARSAQSNAACLNYWMAAIARGDVADLQAFAPVLARWTNIVERIALLTALTNKHLDFDPWQLLADGRIPVQELPPTIVKRLAQRRTSLRLSPVFAYLASLGARYSNTEYLDAMLAAWQAGKRMPTALHYVFGSTAAKRSEFESLAKAYADGDLCDNGLLLGLNLASLSRGGSLPSRLEKMIRCKYVVRNDHRLRSLLQAVSSAHQMKCEAEVIKILCWPEDGAVLDLLFCEMVPAKGDHEATFGFWPACDWRSSSILD